VGVVFVYSQGYYADIGPHIFPTEKYRRVRDELVRRELPGSRWIEPRPATADDLRRVHESDYVADLLAARSTPRTVSSELPISGEIIKSFLLATGGTMAACDAALAGGCAVNLAGGFHHAFPDHAEGFCYVNDIAVAIRGVEAARDGMRVAVIDCDLHQGNGTAFIFRNDPTVYTFSIHQRDLYPPKEDGSWDIHLPNGVEDEEYLALLKQAVPNILDRFRPALVVYQAGADPYERDQLGDLRLTVEGLKRRDSLVLGECKARGAPVAVLLGGGYARDVRDTVMIHVNTCLAAIEHFA
jgi:acetoin utilization deacetylase AcuC-like enzyme